MTIRQQLIERATRHLITWNWRTFLNQAGYPHKSDKLPKFVQEQTGQVYCLRDYSNAHYSLEETVLTLGNEQVKAYYNQLSEQAFVRLFNEVTRKSEQRLKERKERWAYYQQKGNVKELARMREL